MKRNTAQRSAVLRVFERISRPLGPLVPMPVAAIDELRRVFGMQ